MYYLSRKNMKYRTLLLECKSLSGKLTAIFLMPETKAKRWHMYQTLE